METNRSEYWLKAETEARKNVWEMNWVGTVTVSTLCNRDLILFMNIKIKEEK